MMKERTSLDQAERDRMSHWDILDCPLDMKTDFTGKAI